MILIVDQLIERDGADITSASIRFGDFILLLRIDDDMAGCIGGLLEQKIWRYGDKHHEMREKHHEVEDHEEKFNVTEDCEEEREDAFKSAGEVREDEPSNRIEDNPKGVVDRDFEVDDE